MSKETLPTFLTIVNIVVLLSALYFFASTLASHVLEAVVGIINSRGRQLANRLRTALGPQFADAFYADPLILSLKGAGWGQLGLPSYIEPELFGRTVKKLKTAGSAEVTPRVDVITGGLPATDTNFEAKAIEWFKAFNERATGSYVRWTFLRLLIIGLVFAGLMDLDTVNITTALWGNPALTETLASSLDKSFQSMNPGDLSKLDDQQKKKFQDAVANTMTQLQAAIPPAYAWQKSYAALSVKERWTKALGWLLTALAISLGAQFWFNILSDALKLRAAGPKPDGKKEEKK
jgi:hypothetical protein